MKYAVIVFCREDKIVFTIFLHHIIIPHLFLSPGHILHIENDAAVGNFALCHILDGEHMVVFHLEVTTVVIETLAAVPVVRGIDIKAAIEHVGRRVGHIILRKQVSW